MKNSLLPSLIFLLGSAMVAFSVTNPGTLSGLITFSSGELIRASEINQNFEILEQKIEQAPLDYSFGDLCENTWNVELLNSNGTLAYTTTFTWTDTQGFWEMDPFIVDGIVYMPSDPRTDDRFFGNDGHWEWESIFDASLSYSCSFSGRMHSDKQTITGDATLVENWGTVWEGTYVATRN